MNKYKVTYTYSEWENGQGWKLKDSYMGLDDVYTDDDIVLDYTKDNLKSDIQSTGIDATDERHDLCYTYTVYNAETNEELHSVSVWLSEIVDK